MALVWFKKSLKCVIGTEGCIDARFVAQSTRKSIPSGEFGVFAVFVVIIVRIPIKKEILQLAVTYQTVCKGDQCIIID